MNECLWKDYICGLQVCTICKTIKSTKITNYLLENIYAGLYLNKKILAHVFLFHIPSQINVLSDDHNKKSLNIWHNPSLNPSLSDHYEHLSTLEVTNINKFFRTRRRLPNDLLLFVVVSSVNLLLGWHFATETFDISL